MQKIILLLLAATLFCFTGLVAQNPTKKVMLEEFTTALCGMCPPQSHNINDWHENNEHRSVFMTHHAGFGTDAMTNTNASTFCSTFQPSTFGFAPAIMIDRDVYPAVDSVPYMSVNGFDTIANRISNNTASVGITINGNYNSNTRVLNITATASFVQNVASGNYRLCIYLVEDSVVGNGTGYDQKCYSSSFANTYYPNMYNSQTSLIVGYPHRYVQRQTLTSGGTWGPTGVIPNSPALNTPYSSTITYTVPATYNSSRLYVIAYVAKHGSNKYSREILNANDAKVTNMFTTDVETVTIQNATEINSIYPNPANTIINIDFTSINGGVTTTYVTDVTGRVVMKDDEQANLNPGKYTKQFNVADLEEGIYFLVLKNGDNVVSQKFIVSK